MALRAMTWTSAEKGSDVKLWKSGKKLRDNFIRFRRDPDQLMRYHFFLINEGERETERETGLEEDKIYSRVYRLQEIERPFSISLLLL